MDANSDTTAEAAAIGSGNETGYSTTTGMENKDKLRTPQQHPLARDRAPRLSARPSQSAGSCMASEALARAVRTAVNPRPLASSDGPGTDADAELFALPLVRDPEKCWRRIALRQLLCWQAASLQVLFTEVVDIEPRRSSDRTTPPVEAPTKRTITRTELLLRPKLTPGKSTRDLQGLIPVSECRHREIVRRGGKTFWFTCKGCNSRWPREQDEHLEVEVEMRLSLG